MESVCDDGKPSARVGGDGNHRRWYSSQYYIRLLPFPERGKNASNGAKASVERGDSWIQKATFFLPMVTNVDFAEPLCFVRASAKCLPDNCRSCVAALLCSERNRWQFDPGRVAAR